MRFLRKVLPIVLGASSLAIVAGVPGAAPAAADSRCTQASHSHDTWGPWNENDVFSTAYYSGSTYRIQHGHGTLSGAVLHTAAYC